MDKHPGMTEHVGAVPLERTGARKGHRNGHKPRTLRSREGSALARYTTDGIE